MLMFLHICTNRVNEEWRNRYVPIINKCCLGGMLTLVSMPNCNFHNTATLLLLLLLF